MWCRRTYPLLNLLYYSIFAADTLLYDATLTSDPVTLTFDLEHLQCIACDVMKFCAKFEHDRAIRGRIIAISVFDLIILNIAWRAALGSGIIFTKFDLWQLIHAWIIAFLCWYVVTLWPCHMTFWPWKFVVHQVSCCQCLHKIWVKLIPGWIIDNFGIFCMLSHAVTLTFDLLTLNFYGTSGVMRLNDVQNLSELE